MRKPFCHCPNENTFKRRAFEDINCVFINNDEFADWHEIDGVDVKCIIDTDLTSKHPVDAFEGVFQNSVRIHINALDIERPVEGEMLRIDGSLHFVQSVSEEQGMYVIVAVENQS